MELIIEKTRAEYPGTVEWVKEKLASFQPKVVVIENRTCVTINDKVIIGKGYPTHELSYRYNDDLNLFYVYPESDGVHVGLFKEGTDLSDEAYELTEKYLNDLVNEFASWFENKPTSSQAV